MEGLTIPKTQQYKIADREYFWIDIKPKDSKYGIRMRDINQNLKLCYKSELEALAKKIGIDETIGMRKKELVEFLKYKIIFE